MAKTKHQWEYGDFQTPMQLAVSVTELLSRIGINPRSVIEPSCGRGAFLIASAQVFAQAESHTGVEINGQYADELKATLANLGLQTAPTVIHADFFSFDWAGLIGALSDPVLIIGNPPWVTSAELGALDSSNLPAKSNFQNRTGLDAITGKSNFDISEWMLLQHLEWLSGREGAIAVLCKTSVARKVLFHAWKGGLDISDARMYSVDAALHFGASVDACLFVLNIGGPQRAVVCDVYPSLDAQRPSASIGFHDGIVCANSSKYRKWQHLHGSDSNYVWRSGIKHDCTRVMEFDLDGSAIINGGGEIVQIEADYLYPMLKSSDIANGGIRYGRKQMLVTQKFVGEDTGAIKVLAPKTWTYLESHGDLLQRRGSSIYRDKPKYSIFGVGDYSFAKWKVAISGFYKELGFKLVKPYSGKPVVLDDTSYFLPCWSEAEGEFIERMLNSEPATQFLESMIFWADKRPITIEVLKRLDLRALSIELNCESDYIAFSRQRKDRKSEAVSGQLALGIAEKKADYRVRTKIRSDRRVNTKTV